MATTTHLMTVEEFASVPDPPGGRHELHHGEVSLMPPPPRYHAGLQDNVFRWLLRHAEAHFYVRAEFACRPLPEYEVWVVDIGLTTVERWNSIGANDWLAGSPELAIEVLSPSNTRREMEERRDVLFQGGCQQFWVVDGKTRSVTVYTRDGAIQEYCGSDSLSLAPYAPCGLPLTDVFAGI